jgi:hypothetical protein
MHVLPKGLHRIRLTASSPSSCSGRARRCGSLCSGRSRHSRCTKGFLGVDDPVGRGPRPQEEDFLKPRYFTQLKATSPVTHQGRNVGTDPTFTVSPKPRIPLISHFSMCPHELGSLDGGKSRHHPRNDVRLYGGPYPFIQSMARALSVSGSCTFVFRGMRKRRA